MVRRRRRRGARQRSTGRRVLLLGVLVVVVALVAARRPLATLAIHAGLGARGITVVSAEVERLDTGGLVLANLAVGDGSSGFRRLSLIPAFSLSH